MSSQDTTEAVEVDNQTFLLSPSRGELIRIIILSTIVGVLVPALGFVLDKFFIDPVFCRSGELPDFCSNIAPTAYYVSSVMLAFVSVVVLANWQIFRPLIIAVASAASLWGLSRYTSGIVDNSTLEYYALSVGLYISTYVLFYWVMRVRSFTISLAVSIALIVIIRLALTS